MATGDIISCAINSNGWTADIKIEGLGTGGTYDEGYGAGNDPSTAKMIVALTSEGYDNAGSLGTNTRTVYGTFDINTDALRKADPNDSDPDETIDGSDVIIKIPLSNYIYNDDTNITVDIASDWYTESGTGNNSYNDLAVTNNSTLDYTKVVGNNARLQKEIVTGNYYAQFVCAHGFANSNGMVACAKVTVTDEHSNSVNYTITSMSIIRGINNGTDVNSIIGYEQEINVSTLTSGDELTEEWQLYPWVGDADSILNTDDAVNSFPTPLYTNKKNRLYKSGEFGHCVVDATNGNDGTGTVYASQASAESAWSGDNTTAYQTTAAALTALQSYHNVNYSRNHAGSGWIYLTEETHTFNSNNGGVLTEWVTITKMSTASKASTILNPAVANAESPTFLRLYNLTINTANYWDMDDDSYIWLDNIGMTSTGLAIAYACQYVAFTYCTGSIVKQFEQFGSTSWGMGLLRSNNMDDTHASRGYTVIGNNNVTFFERGNTGIPLQDNAIYAFNTHYGSTTDPIITMADVYNIVHGVAIIQNVLERHGSETQNMVSISADSTTTTTNNVILFCNTFAGARANLGYNDQAAGGPYTQTNWFQKNNIFSQWNNKDDTFNNNPSAYGSWAVGYNVGSNSNHFRTSATDEWLGEFQGIYMTKGTAATPLVAGYTNDQSADGGDSGGGDYHLDSGSALIDNSHDLILAYDIEGTARYSGGAIGAYEYPQATGMYNIKKINNSLGVSL